MIWIIGEYAEKIENADELLGHFLDTFKEESYQVAETPTDREAPLTPLQVQLQTLTAIVKLFLKKPDESQVIVQKVLQAATKDCDNADVRDRAYIYWRLLSSDPAAAKVSSLGASASVADTRSLSSCQSATHQLAADDCPRPRSWGSCSRDFVSRFSVSQACATFIGKVRLGARRWPSVLPSKSKSLHIKDWA